MGHAARRRGRSARRTTRATGRYAAIPVAWQRGLQWAAMLAAALTLLGLVALLGGFAYRIGFFPQNEVYRTGTVTVTSCAPAPGAMQQCVATVEQWDAPVLDGLELTEDARVRVLSRTVLQGEVAVVSRAEVLRTAASSSAAGEQSEVIMPADQSVWPPAAKVFAGIGLVMVCLVSVLLWGQLFFEIARLLMLRRKGRR